jgi:hypothetical protein
MLMDLWTLVNDYPADGREPPGGGFVSLDRRCLAVEGFLEATTAPAAYRLAWASPKATCLDLDRTPR